MKKIYIHYVILAFLILQAATVPAQNFLHTDGKKIVDGKGKNVLLRGIGLGGWMLQEGYMLRVNREGQQYRIRERIDSLIGPKLTEEFYNVWLQNHTRRIDIDSLKAWGFNSVRLPMHFNLFTLPVDKEPLASQNTWLEKGFAITDSLLSWCKANKIYLILDLHAAPGGQGNDLNISDRDPSKPSLWQSEANQQKTIALWKKLAERYKNEPWIGGYDIINEPNWGFEDLQNDKNGTKEKTNAPLKKLLMDISKAIREIDKNHIIIIEGNGWGNNYNGLLPPWDSNMVLSFHKYWNKNDQASIQHIIRARDQYNIPVWLGETGENSNVWFTEAIRLLESHNIGWAWWPLKKIGFNNPLEIRSNPNYDQVVNYWNGRGNKPNESNAYSGLLELATYTRLESCFFHRDVIDAMFRQPFSAEAKSFKKNVISDNSIIAAVDYDLGRNGVAYYDKDTADYRTSGIPGAGNRGRVYRNDGVDIRRDSAAYESYYVSDILEGEWLQYSVNVTRKGNYTLRFMIASDSAGRTFSLQTNTASTSREISIPNTGGNRKFQFVEINKIPFNAGKQQLRISAVTGGFNLKSIQFIRER